MMNADACVILRVSPDETLQPDVYVSSACDIILCVTETDIRSAIRLLQSADGDPILRDLTANSFLAIGLSRQV